MTDQEIEEYENKLCSILKQKDQEGQKQLIVNLANEICAPLQGFGNQGQEMAYATRSIHMVLQTEMMLNACGSAKWSCLCAAIAATVACISVLITLARI